jgi:hypothetical protein
MRNRRRRDTLLSNLIIDDVAFAGLCHRSFLNIRTKDSLGSVGIEVNIYLVAWKRENETLWTLPCRGGTLSLEKSKTVVETSLVSWKRESEAL